MKRSCFLDLLCETFRVARGASLFDSLSAEEVLDGDDDESRWRAGRAKFDIEKPSLSPGDAAPYTVHSTSRLRMGLFRRALAADLNISAAKSCGPA